MTFEIGEIVKRIRSHVSGAERAVLAGASRLARSVGSDRGPDATAGDRQSGIVNTKLLESLNMKAVLQREGKGFVRVRTGPGSGLIHGVPRDPDIFLSLAVVFF
jgi:hypothetical protein